MSKWTDFLSSKLPAKPLQAFHCLGLGRLAIVMGSSFFICLERRKYIFVCVTIDKAVCFQMNSVSVISHQGGCVYHVCLCVLLGLETGFSQGWPFRGVLGEAPAPPAGLGSLTPVCVGCGPRGGGRRPLHSRVFCLCLHLPCLRVKDCGFCAPWCSTGWEGVGGQRYCECPAVLVGKSFCWALLPDPKKRVDG